MDMWSPSLRGLSGRLISHTQLPQTREHCLSFFYKLYGPNVGKDRRVGKERDSRSEKTKNKVSDHVLRFKAEHLVQGL